MALLVGWKGVVLLRRARNSALGRGGSRGGGGETGLEKQDEVGRMESDAEVAEVTPAS